MWQVYVFNLLVALLLAAWYLRAVRRLERRINERIQWYNARADAEEAKYNAARDEIRGSMRAQIDAALTELFSRVNDTWGRQEEQSRAMWTSEMNARRCELIDRELDGTLTLTEAAELADLQNRMRQHVSRVAPLPLDEVRRMRAELLRKAAEAQPKPQT